jgi:hypothetical protein
VRAGQRQTAVGEMIDIDRQSLSFHEVAPLPEDPANRSTVIVRQRGQFSQPDLALLTPCSGRRQPGSVARSPRRCS